MKYSQVKLSVDTFNARFGKAIMLPGFEIVEVWRFSLIEFLAWSLDFKVFRAMFESRKSLSFYNFPFAVRLFSRIIIVFCRKIIFFAVQSAVVHEKQIIKIIRRKFWIFIAFLDPEIYGKV